MRWFRAAPGAKVFSEPHLFGSAVQWEKRDFNPAPSPGETAYVRYDKGANPLGYEGTGHCGSDIAMREGGLESRDPVILTDNEGFAECCGEKPLVICGVQFPEQFVLDNGVVPHCLCVSGSSWLLTYRGIGGPFPGASGVHAWATNWPWYDPGTGPFPVPPEVPSWGTCSYGPPVDSPSRVQFALLVNPDSCTVQLVIFQFWRKATSSNSVFYGADPIPVPLAGPVVLTFPPVTTMHAESCGGSGGGGNPINYTATPFE